MVVLSACSFPVGAADDFDGETVMAVVARAEDRDQLSGIADAIHDWWFDLDTLCFDEANRRVTLDLMAEADYRRAIEGEDVSNDSKLRLVVENASRLEVQDPEQVGYYDLNRLEFDERAGVLKLLTGIPLTAEIGVSTVKVSVEDLGERRLAQ